MVLARPFPLARLIRAGVTGSALDLVESEYNTLDVDGRNALVLYIQQKNDATLRYIYTGSSAPVPPTADPFPQYALRTAVPDGTTLVRKGTLTLDARDYGVTGDGVTDDTAGIVAALAACPEGGEVLLRPGTYLVSTPIGVRRNKGIRGLHAGVWPYDTGGPVRIKAAAGFVGDALIRLSDEEELYGSVGAASGGLYVGPNDQSGISLTRLTLDGFSVAGGIDGVKASGLVRSVRLTEVSVRRCTGSSFHTVGYQRLDGLTYYPRGWRLKGCSADTSGNLGFGLNLLNDSTLIDCLAVNSVSHGFYLAGPGEVILIGCRAPWNKGRGFHITGTSYGNVVLSACTTDRNEQSGVFIDTSGRHPILLSGCAFRRDGRNGNGGGGNYAGVLVSGATTPIVVDGITTETGQDDDASGVMSPQFGLRVLNATSVAVDSGVLFGQQAAYLDGGGNTNLRVGSQVVLMSGSVNSPTITYRPEEGAHAQPSDHGFAAWSFDPATTNTSTALASGVLTLVKVRLTAPATIASICGHITNAGVTLTAGQNLAGLYNAAGVLLGSSADQSAAWASAGAKVMAIAPVSGQSLTNLPPGVYYVALLSVGTTPPQFARASGVGTTNVNLAAGAYRFATYGAGLTALPSPLTLTSAASATVAWWVALA